MKGLPRDRIEEWIIQGRVRSALRLNTSGVVFESRSRLAPPTPPRIIAVTELVGVERLTATSTSPNFLVRVEPREGPGQEYKVQVTPRAMRSVESLGGKIRISVKLLNGVDLPAYEIPVSGQVVPDVQAVPPAVVLGVQPIGKVVQESFSLVSRTGSPFEVRSVRASGEGLTVTRRGTPSEKASWLVQQKVVRTGDQSAPIVIEVQAADGTSEQVTVECSYFGRSPERKWGE